MTQRENALTANIMRHLNSRPATRAIKVHGSALTIGEPDIIACWKGRLLAIEVKTNRVGSKTSALQKWVLLEWRRAGATILVIRSLAQLKRELKALDETSAGSVESHLHLHDTPGTSGSPDV